MTLSGESAAALTQEFERAADMTLPEGRSADRSAVTVTPAGAVSLDPPSDHAGHWPEPGTRDATTSSPGAPADDWPVPPIAEPRGRASFPLLTHPGARAPRPTAESAMWACVTLARASPSGPTERSASAPVPTHEFDSALADTQPAARSPAPMLRAGSEIAGDETPASASRIGH